jgi:hypothetical protein
MKRQELTKVLELVKSAVTDQPIVPIFASFVFNKNSVYGFNDILAIIGPCKTQTVFATGASTLFGFLKNSRATEINFTLSDDEVLIKAGKTKITLPCNHPDEFVFSEPDDSWDVKLNVSPILIEGIKICLITASDDFSLPALMGVSIIIDENINIYSCDGDAISKFKVNKNKKNLTKGYYTLPNEFCNSLIRIGEKSGAKSGKLFINKEWAKVEFDNGYKVYGRIIENDDPVNYEKLIKRTLKTKPKYINIPKGFNFALLRAKVVADIESKATSIDIENNKVRMLTVTNIGNVRDIFKLKEKHPNINVTVNSSLVQRSLSICDKIAILDNCTCFKSGDRLFQIISNMGA